MDYMSHHDVSNWLMQLHELEKTASCNCPSFLKPIHLGTITHVLRRNSAISVGLPDKLTSYANTMNLWGALGLESPMGPVKRAPAGKYIPLQLLQDENDVDIVTASVVEIFSSVCKDGDTLNAVDTMLRELIGNCFAHSEAKDDLYGVICGQVWPAGGKAQIVIVDSGVGIRGSLKQNSDLFAKLYESNACELATQYGITSKPGRGHSGYGLAVARKLMEQGGGSLYVGSYEEYYALNNGIHVSSNKQPTWHGTLLVMEWDLSKKLDIKSVWSSFPQPEGYEDDDFDF